VVVVEHLIGVDIGTTQVKGALLSASGNILAAYTIRHQPVSLGDGHVEQDAEEFWWGGFLRVVNCLLKKADIDSSQIAGIAVSGFFPNLCPVNGLGKPLRPAILYSDNRASDEVVNLNEDFGLQETTEEVLPKLLWLKHHEPEVFEQTHMIFNPSNYVVYRLTGVYGIDYLSAYGFGALYDEQQGTWDKKICKALSVSPGSLPELFTSTAVVGGVSTEASQVTGLCQGTPVVMGTADSYATMLGATVLEPGDCLISYGTTGLGVLLNDDMAMLLSKRPVGLQKKMSTFTYLLSLGSSLEWFKAQFCNEEDAIASGSSGLSRMLDEKAEAISAGAEGLVVLPYLLGLRVPVWEPRARGLIYGLTTKHNKYHIWRAMLEAFGYELLSGIDLVVQEGAEPKRYFAAGGGARSPIWRQIVSDIIGQAQVYSDMDTSVASAFLAGYGIGMFDRMEQIKEWSLTADVTKPSAGLGDYGEAYRNYRKIRRRLVEEITR
jgi:xylulokinase